MHVKPSARAHTAAPHYGSHCHQPRSFCVYFNTPLPVAQAFPKWAKWRAGLRTGDVNLRECKSRAGAKDFDLARTLLGSRPRGAAPGSPHVCAHPPGLWTPNDEFECETCTVCGLVLSQHKRRIADQRDVSASSLFMEEASAARRAMGMPPKDAYHKMLMRTTAHLSLPHAITDGALQLWRVVARERLLIEVDPPPIAAAAALIHVARPQQKIASRSLRRALLMPQVNPGSLYRCGKRT